MGGMCLASLLMTVLDALTPSLRGLIADALDESQEAVVAGARALAGGFVGGLKTLAATASGASGVLRAVRGMDVGLLFDASPLLDTDWRSDGGQPSLLGNRARPLSDAAAAQAGLRPESGRALLRVVEPLVLAGIARSGVASDEAGLRSYLRSVEAEATRWAPPEGAPSSAPRPEPLTSQPPAQLASAGAPGGVGRGRTLWILLALVMLALALLFSVTRG